MTVHKEYDKIAHSGGWWIFSWWDNGNPLPVPPIQRVKKTDLQDEKNNLNIIINGAQMTNAQKIVWCEANHPILLQIPIWQARIAEINTDLIGMTEGK